MALVMQFIFCIMTVAALAASAPYLVIEFVSWVDSVPFLVTSATFWRLGLFLG
jgi:hypothetical protein